MTRLLIILSFYCFVQHSIAQQSSSFLFRNLTINDGLSQNSVISIVEDKTGFLWFATQDGLNRYDGKDFFSLPKTFDDKTTSNDRRLGKIISISDRVLWLITTNGKLESFDLFNYQTTPVEILPGTDFVLPKLSTMLRDSKGDIWLGTQNEGLICFKYGARQARQLKEPVPGNNAVRCVNNIYEDAQQNIWCATGDGLLLYSSEGVFKKHFLSSVSPSSPHLSFSSITQDKAGNIWAGSFGNGLFIKQKNTGDFTAFRGLKNFELQSTSLVVESLLADENNMLWVGTYGKGLFVHNINDSATQQFLNNKANVYSIGFNDVLEIYRDKQGSIWLGTDGGGVSYYSQQINNFNLVSNSNVPADISVAPIRSITVDEDGIVWVGTSSGGFTSIDVKRKKYQTYFLSSFNKEVSNSNRIVSLSADDDYIWVGTQGNGLLLFDTKNRTQKKWLHPQAVSSLNIPDNTIWCITKEADHKIWCGTQTGLLMLIDKDKGLLENILPPAGHDSAYNGAIRVISKMNDSILLIGRENGIINFFNLFDHSFSKTSVDVSGQLGIPIVLKSILFKYPVIWIGTLGNGLLSYNINTTQLSSYTEQEGLPNSTVYGILDDEFNNLWISTNKGICSFNLPAPKKDHNQSLFRVFKMSDGLQGNEFNTGAFFKAPDGTLFFGGINGLNFFKPQHFSETAKHTKVAITNIVVDNVGLQKDTTLTFKKQLVLSHQYRSLTFRFSVLDFTSSGRYSYYYQMTGYDKRWIKANDQNFATYTNLPPGKYIFKVKASIPGSDIESEITSMSIIINPPFWKTWWFILMIVAALSAALYGVYRYRINQLLQVQLVRNRIATDLHDEIGSALSNINMLTAITQKKIDHPGEANKYLNRISEEVTASGQALDDIIWSVDTKNDTLEEIIARMRRYAAELFEAKENIRCELDFEEGFASKKINIEQRRDIYLVYKEALNNIYKHSHATCFTVKVFLNGNMLHLQIKDNGVGFDTSRTTHRNGLKNMKTRIERWRGEIVFTSGPDGSNIDVEVPV
ncbi:MAG: two-component regulator propeller domain-containing protein [Agriterribacter sp.]